MSGPSSRYALELAEQQARRNIAPRERDDSPGFAGQSTWSAAAKLAADASKRGGARLGAGRKAIDGATQVVQVCVTIRPDQRPMLVKLGGSPWVRGAIDAAAREKAHSANAE